MDHRLRGRHTTFSAEVQLATFEWIFLQLRHLSFPFFPMELFPLTGLRTFRVLPKVSV